MRSADPSLADPALWDSPAARRAGAVLSIDLGAIRENYRRLQAELGATPCAAVCKADAYGLGLGDVAPALAAEGATQFFVATLDEAIALRGILAEPCPAAEIHVLNGLMPGCEGDYLAHRLRPVLNSLGDIEAWARRAAAEGRALPAAVHLDSGMCRLGLPPRELDRLAAEPERLSGIEVALLMSHLACAEDREGPMNARQLADFRAALTRLPRAPASLANSPGVFLGPDYHFDLARPGVALYGVNPLPGKPNPMVQVVGLKARILQVREIDAPQSVGYGADYRAGGPMRVATLGVGYADGYLRSLSDKGSAFIAGQRVAVIGRVSMDLITLDVTDVPPAQARPGGIVDLLDPEQGPDRLADEAGTIGYEILTALGRRYHRVYSGA